MSLWGSLLTLYRTLRWSNLKLIYENGVPGVRWSGAKAGRESNRRRKAAKAERAAAKALRRRSR